MNLSLLDPAALRARVAGRSYWEARFRDGRSIGEWALDWTLLPRTGLIELRLICPNGETAVLGNTKDASDRLFQFKVAEVRAGSRGTLSHVIGLITSTSGQCTCIAWDYRAHKLTPPWTDNFYAMQYEGVGALSAENLGVKT